MRVVSINGKVFYCYFLPVVQSGQACRGPCPITYNNLVNNTARHLETIMSGWTHQEGASSLVIGGGRTAVRMSIGITESS